VPKVQPDLPRECRAQEPTEEAETIEAHLQRVIPEIKGSPASDIVRNEEILLEPSNPLMQINGRMCFVLDNHSIDTRSSHVSFGG
jgi:hypothetical protein